MLTAGLLVTGCATGTSSPGGDGSPGPDGSVTEAGSDAAVDQPLPCGPSGCDDNRACTDDSCVGGSCVFALKAGFCLIQGACVKDGVVQPGTSCSACSASSSPKAWTDDPSRCKDDGLPCTSSTCSKGSCSDTLQSGYCLISGKCVSDGTANPLNECRACAASASTSTYTNKTNGTLCASDNKSCTDDVCQAGTCTHTPGAGHCLIGGNCYVQGVSHPTNPCLYCAGGATSWTQRPQGSACPGGKCVAGACCTGCVSGSSCLPGTTTAACGTGGGACVSCASGYSCAGGSCVNQPPQTLNIGPYSKTYSSSSATRGFWFTAPQDFTIVGLRVPTDVGTDVQNIEVLRLNVTPPDFSASTSNFTSLFYATGVAGTSFVKVNLSFKSGQIVGILGARGTTTMNSSYAASYTYNTTLNGKAIVLRRLILQKNLYQQQADQVSNEAAASYGRVEVQYVAN